MQTRISPKVLIEIKGGIVQQITYCDVDGEIEFYVQDRDFASVGESACFQVNGERLSQYEVDKKIQENENEEL